MKVNWGALSITIGLILVAASILAVGLMAEKTLSELSLLRSMPSVKPIPKTEPLPLRT